MTSLRARINELDRALQGHQEDEQERLAIGRTRTMTTAVRDHVPTLVALSASIAELRRSEIEVERPPALEVLPDAIKESREAARQDGLAPGRGDEPAVVRLTNSLVNDVKTQVVPAWQELRQQRPVPIIDEELLGLVAERDPTIVTRYEAAIASLLILRERREPKEGDVQLWAAKVDELRHIAAEVTAAAPSSEVRQFLAASSTPQGASLESLNSEDVQAWLSDPARASRFRVVARGR